MTRSWVAVGYVGVLSLASLSHGVAQVAIPPSDASSPTSSEPSDAANPPDAVNPAALPVDSTQDQNTPDQSRAQVPGISQSPLNPTPTNIPTYRLQPGNPLSPYTSSSANPQSPQLTSPSLYLTGSNDLSTIGTSNALSQAFSQQGAGGFYSEPLVDYDHPPLERLRLGPFDLKAAVVTNVVADDNLRTGDNVIGGGTGGGGGGSKGDISYGVTPAILLQYGDQEGQRGYASLIYSPTFERYVHHSDENSDNYQNVALNAIYPFQRLTLNLTQTYTQTNGVNTDSNVRTMQTASLSTVGATYEVDDKISVSSQLQEVITSYSAPSGEGASGGEGETDTSLNTTATYILSQKMTLAPSLNVGVNKPDDFSQQTYEQGLMGLNYAPTEKIGLYVQGGAELRQYEQGGTKVNPIFSLGAGYTPFDSTTISVGATQSVHSDSAETGNNGNTTNADSVVTTSVDASIIQRIAQRFFLGFDFSYSHNDEQTAPGGGTESGDTTQDTITYRPTFNFAPTGWSSVALYYQYESNESSQPGNTYNDNQVGLSLSAQF